MKHNIICWLYGTLQWCKLFKKHHLHMHCSVSIFKNDNSTKSFILVFNRIKINILAQSLDLINTKIKFSKSNLTANWQGRDRETGQTDRSPLTDLLYSCAFPYPWNTALSMTLFRNVCMISDFREGKHFTCWHVVDRTASTCYVWCVWSRASHELLNLYFTKFQLHHKVKEKEKNPPDSVGQS